MTSLRAMQLPHAIAGGIMLGNLSAKLKGPP
jgi:hypothetical protein